MGRDPGLHQEGFEEEEVDEDAAQAGEAGPGQEGEDAREGQELRGGAGEAREGGREAALNSEKKAEPKPDTSGPYNAKMLALARSRLMDRDPMTEAKKAETEG
jgi:hypothetical protein